MAQDPTQEPDPRPPLTKIEDGLYVGDSLASRRRPILNEHKITAVVSLYSLGGWQHWGQEWYKEIIVEGNHLLLPANDSSTQDLLPELARLCDFIDSRRFNDPNVGSAGNVLVHCDRGISRSPTVVIAYLMRKHGWDVNTALEFVKETRRIRPNSNFMEQLQVWHGVKYEIWEDELQEGVRVPKPEYAKYLAGRAERLKELGLTGNEPILLTSLM